VQNENFVSKLDITRMVILSVAITLVSIWGVIIILDANFWASRNLWIISNIEWKFLGKKGIGKILPAYYADPDFHYTRLYSLHIYFLLLLVAFSLAGVLVFLINPMITLSFQEELAVSSMGVLVLGLLSYSYNRDKAWVKDYYHDRALAIGDRSNFVNYARFYQLKNAWESPLQIWTLGLSLLLFIVMLSSLAIVFGAPFEKSTYGLLALGSLTAIILVLMLQKLVTSNYLNECKSHIQQNVTEEDLEKMSSYKKLKSSVNILNWSIRVLNLLSFISILAILINAIWS
jgi:hypothetical protein